MGDYKKFGGIKALFALHNAPFIFLTLLFILLPLFVIPSAFISFDFSKIILIALGVIVTLVFFLVNLLKKGDLALPRHPIFIALVALLLVYLISSLVSGVKTASFIGYGFETVTFTATLLFALLFLLVSVIFQSRKRLAVAYISFFIVSSLIALFHVFRLFFGTGFLSLGYFTDTTSNTIGKWNELAVFFGLSTILSLMSLAMLKLRTRARAGLVISLLLSVFMLVLVNLATVWWTVGVFSFLLFVYFLSFEGSKLAMVDVAQQENNQETKMKTVGRTISFGSLFVLIVAFVFALTPLGVDMATKINQKYNINSLEVRPSWSATYQIAQGSIKTNPFFGVGPNRFSIKWQLNRPDVNLTNFWNASFFGGIGFIPTAIIETGILGIIAWFLFLASFLFYGLRSLFRKSGDRLLHYFTVSSFVVALYLWTISIVYVPSATILALTFFFTGLSVATAYMNSESQRVLSLFKYKKLNFLVATVLVLFLVASVGLGYVFVERALAFSYFQRGVALASNNSTMDQAASYMLRAEGIAPNDVYYRSIAEVSIARLTEIISSTSNQKTVTDEVKNRFQSVLASGAEAARRAQMWDPENYQNWVSVARVYETIVPVGVEGAADGAKGAYEEALKHSPRNPAIYLALGRLEAAQNNLPKAKEDMNKAIELKSNYLEAIFFLSQVDAAQGDIQASANSIEKIFAAYPNDPNISFRLGILKYQLKDYSGAVAAFEKAISAAPIYANARYFLGLSYEKIGRVPSAIAQFEELTITNPDNEEVKLILSNLKAGKDSFASAKAPVDNKPEKRKKLPVEEKTI